MITKVGKFGLTVAAVELSPSLYFILFYAHSRPSPSGQFVKCDKTSQEPTRQQMSDK